MLTITVGPTVKKSYMSKDIVLKSGTLESHEIRIVLKVVMEILYFM